MASKHIDLFRAVTNIAVTSLALVEGFRWTLRSSFWLGVLSYFFGALVVILGTRLFEGDHWRWRKHLAYPARWLFLTGTALLAAALLRLLYALIL